MYGKANLLNPSLAFSYFNIGNSLLKLNKFEEALFAYN